MRKIFLLALLCCCLLLTALAEAAQVTDVKWGVDKDNVLRFVVDATDSAGYAVELEDGLLKLTVNAKADAGTLKISKIKSAVADSMQVVANGSNTVVRVPLKMRITSGDYKAFTLKKDPVTKRPFRVVLDITAAKKTTSAATGAGTAVAVGTRPVVGNTPTKGGTAAVGTAPKDTPKPVVRTDDKKPETKKDDAKKEDNKKDKDKEKKEEQPVKGSGKFRTSGGLKDKIITLDAGHGGSDPGAIGANGTKEKTITLAITLKVQELLKKKGAKVYMTRTKDVDVYGPNASDKDELQARVNVAEKYNSDLFLSLHINSSVNKSVGGFSTYYYPKTNHDLRIAQAVQKQLTDNFGVDDLGVRQANFYVVKRCSMPAALLEMCFISNPKEETLMQSNWFQKKTASMIVAGIEKYFA